MQGKENGRSHLALVTVAGKDGTAAVAAAPAAARDNAPSLFSAAVPDRYFETTALRDCYARIARAALDSDTVAVVEGERGCGKTTIVRMLQQRVGASRELCYIDVRITQGERYVLDCLRRAFCAGQPVDAETLTVQLVERSRNGSGCLILVDDADKLSVFALLRLFALKRAAAEAGCRLGVVVTMSALNLDAMLARPSFAPYRARGLTRVELPHFTALETADYLRARIESAGLSAAISFDDAQVQRIHQASGGLPLHIKRVAGELLDGTKPKPYRSVRRQQRHARIKHTLIPVALVVVPLACIGLLLNAIFNRPSDNAVVERLMSTAGIEAAGTSIPLPPPAPAVSGIVDRAPETRTARPDKDPVAVAGKPAAPAQSSAPAPPVKQPVSAPVIAAGPGPKLQKPADSTPPVPDTTMQEDERAASTESAVEAETKAEPLAQAPAPNQAPAQASAPDGYAWLRAQDPAFYTLQLAGSEERKDVEQFIDKHTLPGKVVVVEVMRNGKVWYMVLYNSYPTWGEARRDLGALPPQIHRNNPFARRFSSVQAITLAP